MKTLVIYDSIFGNTEKIAQSIAKGLKTKSEAKCLYYKNVQLQEIDEADIVVIGSPTRGFRATPELTAFIKSLEDNLLNGKKIAAFDTRILLSTIKSKALRFVVQNGGYAASPLLKLLKKREESK